MDEYIHGTKYSLYGIRRVPQMKVTTCGNLISYLVLLCELKSINSVIARLLSPKRLWFKKCMKSCDICATNIDPTCDFVIMLLTCACLRAIFSRQEMLFKGTMKIFTHITKITASRAQDLVSVIYRFTYESGTTEYTIKYSRIYWNHFAEELIELGFHRNSNAMLMWSRIK